MPTINNKKLCDLCFEPLPPKSKKCPYCSGEHNVSKHPTSLPEGTILAGKYFVGKVLGKGGFGVTYLCYDLKNNKKVAIKEYFPDTLAHRNSGETTVTTYGGEKDTQFKSGAQKFFEEARLVSHFNGNSNIISVHEFFYENNTAYFAMEYLSGSDMKGYLKEKGKISESEAVYIINRAIDALIIVHSTSTLHRDIAPDNIFLCDDGSVKIIDFGAARNIIANESKSLSVILKHGFAPLEQYQSRGKQGPWTDIYALGVTLYFAITGIMPDDAMTRLDEPELDMTGISEPLTKVLGKMMAVRADSRYADMMAVKRDIAALGIEETAPILPKNEKFYFCTRCGAKIPAGETECKNCIIPVAAKASAKPVDKNKLMKIGAIAGLGLILVILLVILIACPREQGEEYQSEPLVETLETPSETPTEKPTERPTEAPTEDEVETPAERPDEIPTDESSAIPETEAPTERYTDVSTESPTERATEAPTEDEVEIPSSRPIEAPTEKPTEAPSKNPMESPTESATDAPHVHVFEDSEITKQATCTAQGLRTYYCSCGKTKTESIPKIDHNYTNPKETTKATCTTEGVRTYYCSCGKTKTESIPKIDHNYTNPKETTKATCTTEGVRTYYCSCGKTKTESIPKIDHDFSRSEVTQEATHKSEGIRTYYCECGETKTETIPKLEGVQYKREGNTLIFYGEGPMDFIYTDITYESQITSVIIQSGVTTISNYAFKEFTNLTSVSIASSVTSIGNGAFDDCTSLASISIPSSVTEIGDYAFFKCDALKSVTVPYGVKKIGICAFAQCAYLASVSISNSVTEIGESAFSSCDSLKSIVIPNSVKKIEPKTFFSCDSLVSVTIPGSVTSIGSKAFWYCVSLSSITIENGVKTIGDSAFEVCESLKSITIPNSVTTIGSRAFYIFDLETVYIDNREGAVSLGSYAFLSFTQIIYLR